jgi:putative intracellular protease/amidase
VRVIACAAQRQEVDASTDDVESGGYDALVIPGGYAPDRLRRAGHVLDLVRDFDHARTTWARRIPTP